MTDDNLKTKYGTDTGMTVPDDYFEDLNRRILQTLPGYPERPKVVEMSRWQRFKPYVYLAAMFAGIWLMMSVFHRVSGIEVTNFDNPPAAVAEAIDNTGGELLAYAVPADYPLIEDASESFDNIDDFEAAFGYDLKPEYDDML